MPFVFKRLVLIVSITAAFAADKERQAFRAPEASSLPHRQTNGKVTIGADAYVSGDKLKPAFGKLVPYQYGILPVLVVIQNDSGQTIRLEKLQAEYAGPNGDRVGATPAGDVRFSRGVDRPTVQQTPFPLPKKKNPLNVWEIEGRAFSAQMLPAGNSASGFYYFQTGLQSGSTIYISGLSEAGTGKALLFFEIPLENGK